MYACEEYNYVYFTLDKTIQRKHIFDKNFRIYRARTHHMDKHFHIHIL